MWINLTNPQKIWYSTNIDKTRVKEKAARSLVCDPILRISEVDL